MNNMKHQCRISVLVRNPCRLYLLFATTCFLVLLLMLPLLKCVARLWTLSWIVKPRKGTACWVLTTYTRTELGPSLA